MAFNPKSEYIITSKEISIKDFFDYTEDYVTRPPYQRKAVWSRKKKQALMDSLFRRYYIPKLVIREVRLDENTTVFEIVDGQQRITSFGRFVTNKLAIKDENALEQYMLNIQIKDKKAASIDLATGTGKSWVIYGVAQLALAEGLVDKVLVLCPSLTIEEELKKKV